MSDIESEFQSKQYGDAVDNLPACMPQNFNPQKFVIKPVTYPNFENTDEQNEGKIQFSQQIINNEPNLNQPLVAIYVPIIYNDIDLNLQKRVFLSKINQLLICQQLFQVGLPVTCSLIGPFYKIFSTIFNYNYNEISVTFILLCWINVLFFLIVRFNKQLRKVKPYFIHQNKKNKIIYKIYFILYSIFINDVILFQDSVLSTLIFNISLANLVLLISFQIQLEKQQSLQMKCIKVNILAFLFNAFWSVFFLLFVWLILHPDFRQDTYFGISAILIFLWPFIFTFIYILSLLSVYKGKFQLELQQEHIGSVLVIINMFFFWVEDD